MDAPQQFQAFNGYKAYIYYNFEQFSKKKFCSNKQQQATFYVIIPHASSQTEHSMQLV